MSALSYFSDVDDTNQIALEYEPLEVSRPQFEDNTFEFTSVTGWADSPPTPSETYSNNPGASRVGAIVTISGQGLPHSKVLLLEAKYLEGGNIKFYRYSKDTPESFYGTIKPPAFQRVGYDSASGEELYNYTIRMMLTQ